MLDDPDHGVQFAVRAGSFWMPDEFDLVSLPRASFDRVYRLLRANRPDDLDEWMRVWHIVVAAERVRLEMRAGRHAKTRALGGM